MCGIDAWIWRWCIFTDQGSVHLCLFWIVCILPSLPAVHRMMVLVNFLQEISRSGVLLGFQMLQFLLKSLFVWGMAPQQNMTENRDPKPANVYCSSERVLIFEGPRRKSSTLVSF